MSKPFRGDAISRLESKPITQKKKSFASLRNSKGGNPLRTQYILARYANTIFCTNHCISARNNLFRWNTRKTKPEEIMEQTAFVLLVFSNGMVSRENLDSYLEEQQEQDKNNM